MRTRALRASVLAATLVMLTALLSAGPVRASGGVRHANASVRRAVRGGPGTWTKISPTESGFNKVGMFRTNDGKLHLVYQIANQNGRSLKWATISIAGQLLASGATPVTNWETAEGDPVLVTDGSGGMQALFKGGVDTNPSHFFARGPDYHITSSNGTTWALPRETIGQHTDLNGGFAAAGEPNGTPVASFGLNQTLWFHEGVDPNAPSSTSDGEIDGPPGTFGLSNQNLVVADNGSVWEAWYGEGNTTQTTGYFVEQILPSQGQPTKAPNSGLLNKDNSPRFGARVALVARPGGGVYMAYCSPTSTQTCDHVNYWKVGTGTAKTVPDSGTHNAQSVGLAAGKQGRISIFWMDFTQNKIHVIRTDPAASVFGVDRIIKPPPATFIFNQLQGEGTFGRLDLVANVLLNKPGNPIDFWHTQVLAGLSLTATPIKFSNTAAHVVSFTVKDAGQAVQGVKISCQGLTKTDTTDGSGKAQLTFAKGTKPGKHVCTASNPDYNPGKLTVTT